MLLSPRMSFCLASKTEVERDHKYILFLMYWEPLGIGPEQTES